MVKKNISRIVILILVYISHAAVDRFPSLERDRAESSMTDEQRRNRGGTKPTEHNHQREVIFALPSLQLHLKTEHLQTTNTPDGAGMFLFF